MTLAQAYAARVAGETVACSMALAEGVPYGDPPYRPAEGTFAHFACESCGLVICFAQASP